MRKFLWSIPGLTIYAYAINVLIQWGTYSYFGIPAEYVDASITSNIIGFFSLFLLAKGVVTALGWQLLLLMVPAVVVFAFYFFSITVQKITVGIVTILIIALPYGCYRFGNLIGKVQTYYYVPVADCVTIGTATGFVIPGFIGDKAILIPIDTQNKMIGGFTLKDISQIPCAVQMQPTGRITK